MFLKIYWGHGHILNPEKQDVKPVLPPETQDFTKVFKVMLCPQSMSL